MPGRVGGGHLRFVRHFRYVLDDNKFSPGVVCAEATIRGARGIDPTRSSNIYCRLYLIIYLLFCRLSKFWLVRSKDQRLSIMERWKLIGVEFRCYYSWSPSGTPSVLSRLLHLHLSCFRRRGSALHITCWSVRDLHFNYVAYSPNHYLVVLRVLSSFHLIQASIYLIKSTTIVS
jgi:hypothetical protein